MGFFSISETDSENCAGIPFSFTYFVILLELEIFNHNKYFIGQDVNYPSTVFFSLLRFNSNNE